MGIFKKIFGGVENSRNTAIRKYEVGQRVPPHKESYRIAKKALAENEKELRKLRGD